MNVSAAAPPRVWAHEHVNIKQPTNHPAPATAVAIITSTEQMYPAAAAQLLVWGM
jgi:hypothetical protein